MKSCVIRSIFPETRLTTGKRILIIALLKNVQKCKDYDEESTLTGNIAESRDGGNRYQYRSVENHF